MAKRKSLSGMDYFFSKKSKLDQSLPPDKEQSTTDTHEEDQINLINVAVEGEVSENVEQSQELIQNQVIQSHPSAPVHIVDIGILPTHTSGGRTRKFSLDWYNKFPWLHWHNGLLLCHPCAVVASQSGLVLTKRIETAFSSRGVACNWEKAMETFGTHNRSEAHKEAVEKLKLMKTNTSVILLLDKHASAEQLDSRAALRIIATTLLTLGQTGTAIRGKVEEQGNFITWINRRAEDVPVLKKFLGNRLSFLSHDIQNELLGLMANNILRQILLKVNKSPYFSIIVDETTDVSTKEQVSICARFLTDDMTPKEMFLGLYETNSTTGETLTHVIIDALTRFGLPLEKLRGQCYDGASNMSGAFRGVQARVKELQPQALYVHCTAHSLNLALQSTIENSVIRDGFQYLNDVYVLFKRSAKRLEILNKANGKIKSLCPTRWTMRTAAIESVLESYGSVLEALEEVSLEPGPPEARAKARGLLSQFFTSSMYWSLSVAKVVFVPTEKLSAKVLQDSTTTVAGALAAIRLTHDALMTSRNDATFDRIMKDVAAAQVTHDLDPLVAP